MKISNEKFVKLTKAYEKVETLANDITKLSLEELKKENSLVKTFNDFYFDLLLTEIETKIVVERSEPIRLALIVSKQIE